MQNIIEQTKVLKLLYVEDNEAIREGVMVLFKSLFEDVVEARNGQEGLDKFNNNQFDLIITDLSMPVMDGISMISEIRKFDSNIPILVMSAHDESDYFIKTIELGVDEFLLKPIDMPLMLNTIRKVADKLSLAHMNEKNLSLLMQYQNIVDNSSIVSKSDVSGRITYVNEAFCKISGYTEEELIGKSHNIIRHPDNPKELFKDLWETIKDKKSLWKGIIKNKTKNGDNYYVKSIIQPILDSDGEIQEYIALRDDITHIMNPRRQLKDKLKEHKETFLVIFKIDNYETLLNFYEEEDILQIETLISEKISNLLKDELKEFSFYNLENGELAFFTENFEYRESIKELFENIHKDLTNIYIKANDIEYQPSLLISFAYGTENLLEDAEDGLKELRSSDSFIKLSNGLFLESKKEMSKNIQTINMIKTAIENEKIVSYFQPIVDNKTQEVFKYESLVRLIDESGKVVSPFFFLDISKKAELYTKITNIVLENSFKKLLEIKQKISINISPIDIETKRIKERIYELLEEYKDSANRVSFELLEDENIKSFNEVTEFIKVVKSYGVTISIDDFGSGYSNFERLSFYSPDIVKIDGSLIKDIDTNEHSQNLVETIVSFSKKEGLKTVAEFVENESIFNKLKDMGIDYSQGYYFGKPEEL
jgi:PAS domain S-box-containing protein